LYEFLWFRVVFSLSLYYTPPPSLRCSIFKVLAPLADSFAILPHLFLFVNTFFQKNSVFFEFFFEAVKNVGLSRILPVYSPIILKRFFCFFRNALFFIIFLPQKSKMHIMVTAKKQKEDFT